MTPVSFLAAAPQPAGRGRRVLQSPLRWVGPAVSPPQPQSVQPKIVLPSQQRPPWGSTFVHRREGIGPLACAPPSGVPFGSPGDLAESTELISGTPFGPPGIPEVIFGGIFGCPGSLFGNGNEERSPQFGRTGKQRTAQPVSNPPHSGAAAILPPLTSYVTYVT